jgi:hypothetical protein
LEELAIRGGDVVLFVEIQRLRRAVDPFRRAFNLPEVADGRAVDDDFARDDLSSEIEGKNPMAESEGVG